MDEGKSKKRKYSRYFSKMQGKKFIIPEYQRPYAWDEEKCDILWDDFKIFLKPKKRMKNIF